jgi:microcystin degradation protein MlrC
MRIAAAGIWQETNTFSPLPCGLKDFEEGGLYLGPEVLDRMRGVAELGGLMSATEEEPDPVELIPIIRALAMSSGKVTAEALNFLEDRLTAGLRQAQPMDGVFLALHGAASSETCDDMFGHLANLARQVIGPGVPMVVTLDHHANITRQMIGAADVIVGYHTEPHDPFETGVRGTKILFSLVRGEITPTVAWHKIPMLAPPDRFATAAGPMKEWFDRARAMEELPGVIKVSNFPVQSWLDAPELGWATVVYTNNDPALARNLSSQLANQVWALRNEFWVLNRLPPAEVVREAVEAEEGLVIISDGSDTVGGGSTGDSTCLLREMVRQKVECITLLTMFDPEVVDEAMKAGIGSEITVWVGGKFGTSFNAPVQVTARVGGLAEKLVSTVHYGSFDLGKSALLEIGGVRMVVSEHRGIGGFHWDIYAHFGIDPGQAKIVVIKENSNFQYFTQWTKQVLRADCPGVAWWDLKRFDFVKAPRPIFPLDAVQEWHAEA